MQNITDLLCYHMTNMVGLRLCTPPGAKKFDVFVGHASIVKESFLLLYTCYLTVKFVDTVVLYRP